jgi:hypothetical protein
MSCSRSEGSLYCLRYLLKPDPQEVLGDFPRSTGSENVLDKHVMMSCKQPGLPDGSDGILQNWLCSKLNVSEYLAATTDISEIA